MSRMLCICNNRISDVDCPSEVWHYAFRKSDVDGFLAVDPNYLLKDLYMDYELGYGFWYCNHCGRMYMYPDNYRMWKKVYSISREFPSIPWDEIRKLSEIYVFSDVQLADPLEYDDGYPLSRFLANPPHPYRFFVSKDESTIYAYNNVKKRLAFTYKVEIITSDEEVAQSYLG